MNYLISRVHEMFSSKLSWWAKWFQMDSLTRSTKLFQLPVAELTLKKIHFLVQDGV